MLVRCHLCLWNEFVGIPALLEWFYVQGRGCKASKDAEREHHETQNALQAYIQSRNRLRVVLFYTKRCDGAAFLFLP